jgi:hypothetical protein
MYNSTDETLNDFLCVANDLGKLPSKTILYEAYNTKGILEYITPIIMGEVHTKEIISDFDDDDKKIKVIHERKLLKIGKDIYINFVIANKHDEEERPMISRLALHSYKLIFDDEHGTHHEISTEMPKEFRALMQQLNKI